jgi:hypothetical protein
VCAKKKKKPLDFLHCYHHSIVPFSAWLGFCGWFMPIITGLFFLFGAGIAPAVGPWICLWLAHPHYHWSLGCWSLLVFLVSFVIVSFAAWLGFCGWFITGILDVGLFWCYWSLLVLLVSFGVIGLFCCVAGLLREVYAHYHWSFFFLLFCGWFMPIITGLFVVGHFRCYWSLLFSHIT